MFKVNNRSTKHCSGVVIVNFEYIWHVVLVFFLLTLNMQMPDGILYCLNLNLSVQFRVQSRDPVTFKTELSVTIVNNSFQLLSIFLSQRALS